MRHITIWDRLFEEVVHYFPDIEEDCVDWYPSGQYEITIRLVDGTRAIYDSIVKGVRYIKRPDPNREMIFCDEERYRKECGRKLSKRMNTNGVSYAELSTLTGISRITLSKYVNGASTISTYNAYKIARVLRCSMSELIDIDYIVK